ncbi:MAG: hypothetical protein RLY16_2299 [Bacteroidota bacterium]
MQQCLLAQSVSYKEPYRPQFHFSPKAHWMNDPNGMVYVKGVYHLFYQYYPDSTVWGPMHWGHATSTNLVNWKHEPVALFPDSLGYIFSGSVVVDELNTSKLQGKSIHPPLVAIYTYHHMEKEKAGKIDYQYQAIAYSVDLGKTWTKYHANPVLPNPGTKDFRDPKVMWYAAEKKWVMTLAVGDHVEFYTSPNLIDWQKSGSFGQTEGSHGGVWECPDLFPIKNSTTGKTQWVLLVSIGTGAPGGGSGTQYFVGRFNGKTFVNDNEAAQRLWLDRGCDNYAGVTWSNAPNGRRIFLGWMSNWQYAQVVPTSPWRSAMTLPRDMKLVATSAGNRLQLNPVPTVAKLHQGVPVTIETKKAYPITTNYLDVQFSLSGSTANEFGVLVKNKKGEQLVVGFNRLKNSYFIDRTLAGGTKAFHPAFAGIQEFPRMTTSDSIRMRIYLDRSSVELFAEDGLINMTDLFYPDEPFNQLAIYQKGGAVKLISGTLQGLKSIW